MKITNSLLAIALLLCATAPLTCGQTRQSPLHEDLSKTYGFILGQRLSLNRIKKQYPDLGMRAQQAESEFQLSFGEAERKITVELQEMLGVGFSDYVNGLNEKMAAFHSTQPLNRDLAVSFIAEVALRANGTIPSPYLETLLTYQFRERPAEELARGYSKVFRTKDHPKAKGVDFQITYPSSWRPAEGVRPNIIQKFVSENGRGSEMILIAVKDIPIPAGYKVTKKEIDELFSVKELRDMVPKGARFISAKPIVLDGQKGGMITFDQSSQRLDITLNMRSLHFLTVRGNKMIFVQCIVSKLAGKDAEMQATFTRFEPLFRMVGNSFVLQEQYR